MTLAARALPPPGDPRLTPMREGTASSRLRGLVAADRFVDPVAKVVAQPVVPLTRSPDGMAPLATELLCGEVFEVLEEDGLWAFGQALRDGYVGWVPRPCLEDAMPEPTHRVAVPLCHLYPAADLKTRPGGWLPMGARVRVAGAEGRFLALDPGGFVPAGHLVALDRPAPDWVAVAESFLGLPYLWGGRTAMGIDCSGLVQMALEAAGQACPRDSDMQEAALGETLAPGAELARGDLVFWKGHVGVMVTRRQLLHANAFHMAVRREPLAGAIKRIEANGGGPVTRIARLG